MKRWTLPIAALATLISLTHAMAGELPAMTVWKSPWCGCCGAWVKHIQKAGIKVTVKEVEDLSQVKRTAGIPEALQSCHTAQIGDYKIEGHVPAADIKRLLATMPDIDGLAVPGMPAGSPGMETGEHDAYDVMTFNRDNETTVFSHYE